MSQPRSGYLLGIGSNIEPDNNISLILASLLTHFNQLTLSRILKIPPIGMNSHHDFLNVIVFIETALEHETLKEYCNQIEVRLGRDRNDPERKTKDRSADLDILSAVTFPDDCLRPVNTITDEYFLYPLLEELQAYVAGKPYHLAQQGTEIILDKLRFGQTATTIYRDADTGHKRVI